MNGDMLSGLTGKLRSLAHQQLEAREADGPLVRRLRDVVSTVNDLLGKPIRAGRRRRRFGDRRRAGRSSRRSFASRRR